MLGLELYLVPICFFLNFSFLFTSILFYFKLNSFDFLSIFYVMNVILFYFTSIHSALIKSFISLKKVFKILISIFFNSYVVIWPLCWACLQRIFYGDIPTTQWLKLHTLRHCWNPKWWKIMVDSWPVLVHYILWCSNTTKELFNIL